VIGAEVTLRRFWKTVNIKEEANGGSLVRPLGHVDRVTDKRVGDFLVMLDSRNLRTPGGAKLVIPRDRRLLALLIANEWENQDEVLKQHALPVVSSTTVSDCTGPVTDASDVSRVSCH
jgi:ATP synthase F1 complex assembly factor 2